MMVKRKLTMQVCQTWLSRSCPLNSCLDSIGCIVLFKTSLFSGIFSRQVDRVVELVVRLMGRGRRGKHKLVERNRRETSRTTNLS